MKSQSSLTTFLSIKCRPISLHFIYKCVSPQLKRHAEERSFSKLDYHFPVINLFFSSNHSFKKHLWGYFSGNKFWGFRYFQFIVFAFKSPHTDRRWKQQHLCCANCKVENDMDKLLALQSYLAKTCFKQKREFVKLEKRKVFSCQKSVIRADGGCCDQNMWETEAYIGPKLNVNSGTWKVVRAFGWNNIGLLVSSFTDCWIWATT